MKPQDGETQHLLPLVVLVLANLLVLYPAFFQGGALTPAGALATTAPWNFENGLPYVRNPELREDALWLHPTIALARREPTAGLWDPYSGLGEIGFFRLSTGFWSPLVFLPALLVPYSMAATSIAFLKLNVAYLLCFRFLTRRHLTPAAAALGALCWALAPAMTWGWLSNATAVAAFFPALLLAIDAAPMVPARPFALLAGTAGVTAFLAGGDGPAIRAGLLAGLVYFAVTMFDQPFAQVVRALRRLAISAAVALALLAPALALELAAQPRPPRPVTLVTVAQAALASVWPATLGHPALGTATATLRDHTAYPGIAALALLPLGLLSGRRYRRPLFFVALAAGGLAAAFALQSGALFATGGSELAAANLLALFALAVLAAYGADALGRRYWSRRHLLIGPLLAITLVDLGWHTAEYWDYLPLDKARLEASPAMLYAARKRRETPGRLLTLPPALPAQLGGRYGLELLAGEELRRWDPAPDPLTGDPDAERLEALVPLASLFNVRFLALSPAARAAAPPAAAPAVPEAEPVWLGERQAAGAGGAAARVSQDLYLPRNVERLVLRLRGAGPEGFGPAAPAEGVVRVQLEGDAPAGVLFSRYLDLARLPPLVSLPVGQASGVAGKPLRLTLDRFRGRGRVGVATVAATHPDAAAHGVELGELRIDGVRDPRRLAVAADERGWRAVWLGNDLAVLENRDVLPRYRMVGRAATDSLADVAGSWTTRDFAERVLLAPDDLPRAAPALGPRRARSKWRLRLLEETPVRVRLAASLEEPGILVLSRHLPAALWSVRVDGAPGRLLPAYDALAAVPLPAGDHDVDLRFTFPGKFALIALLAGILGMIAIVIAALAGRVAA